MGNGVVIVFGATGTIGNAVCNHLESVGWRILKGDRNGYPTEDLSVKIDAVVWAQGMNFTGSITETSKEKWHSIWEANVFFIVDTLKTLLDKKAFASSAKMVVIGSVWQEVARSNKLAYITSKAAIGGLVRGLAVELGSQSIAINALLPGVIDSEMSRTQLSSTQIDSIRSETPSGELVDLDSLVNTIGFLISGSHHGINGQCITIDNGWSINRDV